MKQPLIALGIDPGYDRIGWAIGAISRQKVQVIAFGCIETTRSKSLFERYRELDTALADILKQHKPTEAALETLFFSKNKTTALAVSEARGVLLSRCLQHGLSLAEYSPVQIKQTVTGSGAADKKAVEKMVRMQCALPKEATKSLDDALDAVAVLLTHAGARKMLQLSVVR